MLKQTDVVRHLVGGSRDARQDIAHSRIHLAGVRLPGHGIAFLKSHLFSDHGIDLIYGLLIAVKEFLKRRLRARGALGSQKLQTPQHIIQIFQIETELLRPEGRPLSDGGGLCGLEMGEGQRRQFLVFFCEFRKLRNHVHQLFLHQL